VCELTFLNVLCEDPNIFVSIRADLLVVEAQSVKNFMLHRGVVQTAIFLQGDVLSSILTTQVGPTPDMYTVKKWAGIADGMFDGNVFSSLCYLGEFWS